MAITEAEAVAAVNRLLDFGLHKGLLTRRDVNYAANQLLAILHIPEFQREEQPCTEDLPEEILQVLLDYAAEQGIIENTANERDLFDPKLMNTIMPRPSEVERRFWEAYQQSPQQATDFFYQLSIASNYIRKARIDKNIAWQTQTDYGALDITINLSKPEKDPRDIAKAKTAKASSYPKCLLCCENEGFAGNAHRPARDAHRLIPLDMYGEPWYLQYSPYTYYNEHCIILNGQHIPMKIDATTFRNLLHFLDIFPHYFAGSNADLPIVGGSILSHDHYQGGRYVFPMERAQVEQAYTFAEYPQVRAGRVKWPMSTLRLTSPEKKELIALAANILQRWRAYNDESLGILAETEGVPHNTITPIARRRGTDYELDLVLRNNRTTKEHPLGLFHPHAEVHHIKKENIGLIEVLGLAILPARLKTEMAQVKEEWLKGTADIANLPDIAKHAAWYQKIRAKHSNVNAQNIETILRQEIGEVFLEVLHHAGVFKHDTAGIAGFDRFLTSAGGQAIQA